MHYENSEIRGINNDIVLIKGNLSTRNFYIQKAEVELRKGKEKERFIATWKYELPGNSLISIRTRTGIEVARIFLTKDTLLVNDRMNRILYYGKPGFIHRNYGIPQEFLPLIIGDYLKGTDSKGESINCAGGKAIKAAAIKGIKVEYIVDCKLDKLMGIDIFSAERAKSAEFRFSDFIKRNGGLLASRIQIKYYDMNAGVSIKIEKIETPWDGKINFIPGKGYEEKKLD